TCGLDNDYEGVEDALLRLGVRNPEGPPVEPAYYASWRDLFANPFLENPSFDFGASRVHEAVIKQVPGVMKCMASFRPAQELIFLNRMIAGHYGNLCHLRARV